MMDRAVNWLMGAFMILMSAICFPFYLVFCIVKYTIVASAYREDKLLAEWRPSFEALKPMLTAAEFTELSLQAAAELQTEGSKVEPRSMYERIYLLGRQKRLRGE
jgi:hypothetical protein